MESLLILLFAVTVTYVCTNIVFRNAFIAFVAATLITSTLDYFFYAIVFHVSSGEGVFFLPFINAFLCAVAVVVLKIPSMWAWADEREKRKNR